MESPFAAGDRVRVLASFERYGQRFTEGEVLLFEMAWYSRYDEADVYTFKRADGSPVDWYVFRAIPGVLGRPDDPDEWRQRLARL